MVTIRDLIVRLKKHTILSGISCTLTSGITVLIGKSGAGKTTLLKSMVGLIQPTQGEILIDGQPLEALSMAQRSQKIGFVFQQFNLFEHFTVLQNCIDPLLIRGMAYEQACDRALATLKELEMQDYIESYPKNLSGGQQQRVAIARSLCLRPGVLLLDEPTASLDPINTKVLVQLLQRLAKSGLIIGVSSQDMHFVRTLGGCLYYLEDGQMVATSESLIGIDKDSVIGRFMELE